MYHVELRQFPHNFCRFNLSEGELREAILDDWARGGWIELGERKWSPHQAKLTVLDGPELPVDQLSMGRGWRNAARQGHDVTEQLLATARSAAGPPDAGPAGVKTVSTIADGVDRQAPNELHAIGGTKAGLDALAEARLIADSLGLEVLAELAAEPLPIAIAWQLARKRYPERAASDCLKLAEHAIRSLAEARLVVLMAPVADGQHEACASREQVERVLHAIDSWAGAEGSAPALISRA